MKYAIISDIHSNYEAFVSVIEEIKNEKVDKIFCCGDIVGYGPNPNECVDMIKHHSIISVLGNHDVAVLDKVDLSWFNKDARDAIVINKKLLSFENFKFLDKLSTSFMENDFLFVHGSPRDNIYEYLLDLNSLKINVKFMKQKVCFCGHTHCPFIYSFDTETEKGEVFYSDEVVFEIEKSKKYIINVGSVGQPRDQDSRACYVIFDLKESTIKFNRVKYNINLTQKKMFLLNMPEFLITRLDFGE